MSGTITCAMLGTEPILSSVLAPRLILAMTNCSPRPCRRRCDLIEDRVGLRRRGVAPAPAAEQLDADRRLGVLHDAADAGRRDVEQARRAANRAGDHDGADHLDLPQGEHLRVPGAPAPPPH
jgi:hypothetical protein